MNGTTDSHAPAVTWAKVITIVVFVVLGAACGLLVAWLIDSDAYYLGAVLCGIIGLCVGFFLANARSGRT